ncbi:glycoside hydrolase family 3 protein [Vibrio mediterranei]|uniref:1,4-beta-D-glucan glucohydrolase n=1 Tax=Vibrio mediterranei TaxID=689 RepID=A0ABX5DAB7_9VIBR|nr:glycoside hydrolase family 3 protein [Vibrio mediterranei]PCD88509.1 1,4-beta-D-glucan glucohydrolase [Vibrio mediterranei]PRQ66625.1 1,4-beta-D-glucan glucohydrolase [Vibrio mediterranei]
MSYQTPYFKEWPQIKSAIAKDAAIENEVASIVAQMTTEEKLGQMIQPDLRGVSPEEAKQYKLGSILNGGGAWPNENKHSSAQDWSDKADEFWHAIEEAYADRPFRIPFMWATDAVHGHNNVFSATVFPHNIGLGAARDPELIQRIGKITAVEVAATGLDWTFAPTVATPRDLRWGRVYEGYSEDPEITFAYAAKMVTGLQGTADDLKGEHHVISNVKHWVGDGGTLTGVDRGKNGYSEDLLRNIHAMGYFSGLEAGAQVVMSSFNTWENEANYDHNPEVGERYNYKIHGSKYLLNDVLKGKMGFDGLIVTDWHGHAEVSKCTDGDATYAINAGNDVLMVPVHEHWIAVYHKALEDIKSGVIPMERIDDAVTRILRVKMRAGLWDKPSPKKRALAGKQSLLGAPEHREVAREAVRKSLVLLKNKDQLLPLNPNQKVLLTGSAADDLQKQSGGWNLTWQGDENTLDDFPGATTFKMALVNELSCDNVTYDPQLESTIQAGDVAIVVIGEDPYAEMMGDIKAWQTLEFGKLKRSYKADVEKIHKLHKLGAKVITVFYSGRPLYLNEEIAKSNAFVAAWLPGSEGEGITDVLIADAQGNARYDFQGKLSYSWPNKKRSATVSRIPPHIPDYQVSELEQSPLGEHAPLFEYGYGLNYSDTLQQADLDQIELDEAGTQGEGVADSATEIYGIKSTIGDFQLKVADFVHWIGSDVSRNNPMSLRTIDTKPYNYQQQQDAVELTFKGGFAAAYIQTGGGGVENLTGYGSEKGTLSFEVKVSKAATHPVYLSLQKWTENKIDDDVIKLDISAQLQTLDEFVVVNIPVGWFVEQGVELAYLDTPFMLFTAGELTTVLANIRWYNR